MASLCAMGLQILAEAIYKIGAEPEKLRLLVFWLFTGSCAAQDLWKKEIPLLTYLMFAVAGGMVACFYPIAPFDFALRLLPGLGLLLLVRLLPGSIGGGDALYFLTAAFYKPLNFLAALLFLSVFLSGLAALGFFIKSAGKGLAIAVKQESKDRTNPKKQTLPYLCFVLLALWLLTN